MGINSVNKIEVCGKKNIHLIDEIFTSRENIGFCSIDSDLAWRLWVQIAQQNQSPVVRPIYIFNIPKKENRMKNMAKQAHIEKQSKVIQVSP
ncbi:MAG: hypothetical protein EZS28_005602 [Streblomastix strix]|uniref:Uncharacterized protein n=1 Tax=Streblomastix strix TaxID=222440 RepID=A0A5J4WWL0_9EUKA|nr:MAG: hypothetical protein EZS28_005602 [Streblomastix strix]